MLATELCGLTLANPLVLASGILGVSGSLLRRIAKLGMGAVTSKSIGPRPREGYLNPSIIEIAKDTYLNAVGLANPGVDEFVKEIPPAKVEGVPLIVSIFGDVEEDYAKVAWKVEDAGADAVELNISCPHAHVSSIGADPSLARKTVALVKETIKIPVFVKLNPNVTSIVDVAVAVQDAGADAVVAINTIRGMAIDTEFMKPILHNKSGGVSGRAIKPMAVKAVYDLYDALDIPIIGCGGIFSGLDVAEFLLAGASAVQVGTAFVHGLEIIPRIKNELEEYMKLHDFTKISEMTGRAHDE